MKKTWKRLCALFLAVVMTLSLLPTAAFAADGVSTQAAGDLRIPGYHRVTEMTADIDNTSTRKGLEEGNYLIVAPYDGKYYMLYPGTTGAAGTNSARLEVDANGKATGYKPGYGSVYDSATLSTNWAAAENHIVARGGGRHWSHDTNTFDQWWEGYTVTATAGDKTYSLFKSGVCYSESTDGQTAINIDKNGTAYLRSGTGSTLGSYLVFYTPNMNFNQNSGKDTTTNIGDLMLFKRNAEVGQHIPALENVLIGSDTEWTGKWSGDISADSSAKTITSNTYGLNHTSTWNGDDLEDLKNFLIQFTFQPTFAPTDTTVSGAAGNSEEYFKVRMMNGGEDWLQVRFYLGANNSKAEIQVARQGNSGADAARWTAAQNAGITWEKNGSYPVDILYDNGEVTVYWNGTAILCENVPLTQTGDNEYSLATNKLQFASQGNSQRHVISNLVVSTEPDPVDPPAPETPAYTEANVDAGLFDVGANPTQNSSGVWSANYSNPMNADGTATDGTVIVATASSYQSGSSSDGEAFYAVDGGTVYTTSDDDKKVWHTQYDNPPTPHWIQLEIVGDAADAPWLTGLRYYPKSGTSTGGNGNVLKCEVCVSDDGVNWSTVTPENHAWTRDPSNSSGWKYVEFTAPVQAKYVRLYGTETTNNYMNAAEVRLVKAENQEPKTVSHTFTVKTTREDPAVALQGAVIAIAGQTLTTGDKGTAIADLLEGKTYTAQVSCVDHEAQTVSVANVAEGGTTAVTLTAINRTITGKVTIAAKEGETPQDLGGAKVTLVNANAGLTTLANGPEATTKSDGTYTLNINTVAAGSYKVRVSKDGYNAVIVGTGDNNAAVVVAAERSDETHPNVNATLTAIETEENEAKFSYDMSDGHQPTLSFAAAGTNPTETYSDGKLQLRFTDEHRANNLTKITGTGVKDGVVEFDATRTEGNARFGLAFRCENSSNWIYIGQVNSSTTWTYNHWNNGTELWGPDISGPSFGVGDTRHFKVEIWNEIPEGDTTEKTYASLTIDGVEVFKKADLSNWSYNGVAPGYTIGNHNGTVPVQKAADVGFISGNEGYVPSAVTIDNLYIFRDDPTYTVTLPASGAAVELEAKISTSANPDGEDLGTAEGSTEKNQAAAGDVIVITRQTPETDDGKALASVTVEETGGSRTVEATQTADGVFTFTMPAYAVTVTGTLAKSFSIELPNTAPQVNKPYGVTVTPSEATVTYAWEVEGTEGQGNFHAVTEAEATVDGGSITPKNIAGKALRVTVTGTGDYTGIKTLTTLPVRQADVLVNTVGLQRHEITMWTNDESKSSDGNSLEVGHEVTLIATTSPTTPSYVNLTWVSADDEIAKVEKVTGEDSTQATLTAVGNGTTTVTVTACDEEDNPLTDAEGHEIKDVIEVTVKTRPTAVTVTTDEGGETVDLTAQGAKPLILWANADKTQSATLTAELTAAVTGTGEDGEEETGDLTVSDDEKGLTWTITDKPQNLEIAVTPGEDNTATVQVLNTGMDNVGEVTVTVTSTTNAEATAEFTVIVKRQIETGIRITGEAKYGEKLGWEFQNTVGGNSDLTYQWYRLDAETFATIGSGEGDDKVTLESLLGKTAEISGETGNTTGADDVDVSYTLAQDDIGNYIVVKVVPAEDNKYYEGTKIAVTDKPVERADASGKPELDSVKLSAENAKDGKIIITNWDENATYEILAPAAEGEEAKWASANVTDETVIIQGEDGETTITRHVIAGLDAGNYQVRIGETTTEKASDPVDITVPEANATTYRVLLGEIQHGTIRRSPTSAVAGATVNITVTPDAGYDFDEDSLKVTYKGEKTEPVEGDNETEPDEGDGKTEPELVDIEVDLTEVTDSEGKITGYTFEMPAADVTISATFTIKKVTITHNLTNLTCSLPEGSDLGEGHIAHEVDWGKVTSITLTPDEGYTWPESITIVHEDGEACNEFTYRRGVITFDEGALERDITITATAEKNVYAVQYTPLTNLTTASDLTAEHGEEYTGVLTSTDDDYKVPATITVTMGGKELTLNGAENGYTYTVDETAGTGTIVISNVTGAVVITAAGERITVPVTKVEISIGHSDPGTAEEQKNVPHVGDTLTANVTPSNASVTYQWVYVNDDGSTTPIADAGNMTYKVTQEDYEGGKKIGVKVLGITAAGFSGEQVDTLAAVVGPQSTPTTGVTLNAFTHSMSVGQSFTLTANVQPETATNKAVTWKVINDQNAEITDESIVKLTDNEDGTATVEGKGVGTVRVVATNSGGQTARCVVAVERANQYTVSYMVVHQTEHENEEEHPVTVTLKEGTTTVENHGAVLAGTTVTVEVNDPKAGDAVSVAVTASNGTSVTATKGSGNTWTFTMPGYDVNVLVTVAAKVTSVSLSQNTANVGVGKTIGLIATVEPAEANQAVTWSSSAPAVATVSASGLVTGRTTGTATITVTSVENPEMKDTCVVTVQVDKTALNMAINTANTAKTGVTANLAANTNEVEAGTRFTAQANIDALDAAITAATTVASSGAATQEQVDAAVTALNAAVATFNSQVKIGTKLPDVPVERVSLTLSDGTAIPSTGIQVAKDATVQLVANVEPEEATNKSVTWSSSSATIASVDQTGKVTGVTAGGSVTITVTTNDGSKTATCTVTVTKKSVADAASISFTGRVQAGQQLTANVSGVPEDQLNFQWILVDGTNETPIAGETGKSYTPTSDDVDKTLKVEVTAKDTSTEWTGSYRSQATSQVVNANVNFYDVTATLNGATASGMPSSVKENDPLEFTLSIDDAHVIVNVTVTMDGTSVPGAYDEDNGKIFIEHVIGDVEITVVTKPVAKLKSLSLSEGTLAPEFNGDTTSYTASVAYSVESVTVTATGVGDDAIVTVFKVEGTDKTECANKVVALDEGDNVITVTVTNGTESKDYTITVNREALKQITASAEDVTVTYDGNPHSITVTVTAPTTGATVKYKVDDVYGDTNPSYTNAGEYEVEYQITAAGYATETGSATLTIEKATTWPAPTGLTGSKCTDADNDDGKIEGLDATLVYQYSKDDGTTWIDVDEGETSITDLTPGDYVVRLKENDNHVASDNSTPIRISAYDAITYLITKGTPANGSFTVSTTEAEAGVTVTVTVAPNTGYKLKADGLKVTKTDETTEVVSTAKVNDTTYTFTMPNYPVTVTAEFEKITYTVTVTVNNGSADPAGPATVENGESYSTTVEADTNYDLPDEITVAKDDGTALVVDTDYTYDKDTGVITITSVSGNVTITVTCEAKIITIDGTVTIRGTAKYDETLEADVTGITPEAARSGLTYQWKRTNKGGIINIGTGSTYKLVGADIGATITVTVTAGANTGYAGSKTSAPTAEVAKADGLPAPTGNTPSGKPEGVAPTSAADNDGKIVGLEPIYTYEVSTTADEAGTATWSEYTTNADGEIENLAHGTYYVREVQDGYHKRNDQVVVVVPRYGATMYNIDRSGLINGSVLYNGDKAEAGTRIELKVEPNPGYRYVEDSLKVTYLDENGEKQVLLPTKVAAGVEFEGHTLTYDFYYFTMPAADVKISAEFERITHTVTVNVTGGTITTAGPAAVGHGDRYEVTVGANSGYKLPESITVTMAGNALTAGVGYTYDKDTGAITIASVTGTVTITVICEAESTQPSVTTPVTPPSSGTTTTTTTNPDGSTTTTVTDNKTGTVTETTEKPDGTVEIVETKKDGTVTTTTENPDGSTEVVETKPDGTVTETNTDPEGGKVEKVTTPDEDVTITVTDAEGEVLAKVELPGEIPEPETRFVDVPEGHWADEAIHNMAALEVVNGVGDDRYDMNSGMTRGALATVLSRMSNGQEGLESSFTDVAADKWYADGIAWAAKTGVVTGYSATEFGPNDTITREQLAVMLCRYARLLGMDTTADSSALDSFKDGSNTHSWAADSIAWCVENGILKGMGNDTLAPTATATRAQVAVMLQRFIDLMK